MGDAYALFTVKGKTRLGRNYIRKSQGIRDKAVRASMPDEGEWNY